MTVYIMEAFKMQKNTLLTLLIVLSLLVNPLNAHAYLDPGTGSMVLQLLLAGVAGLGVVVKLFWGKLSAPFRCLFKNKDNNSAQ